MNTNATLCLQNTLVMPVFKVQRTSVMFTTLFIVPKWPKTPIIGHLTSMVSTLIYNRYRDRVELIKHGGCVQYHAFLEKSHPAPLS